MKTYELTSHDSSFECFSNNYESGNDIVSDNKSMIETHVVTKRYYNYFKGITKITTMRVLYKTAKNVEYNCDINELPEGMFPLTILSNGMNLE